MKYPKFKVGQTYRYSHPDHQGMSYLNLPVKCLAEDRDGLPVLQCLKGSNTPFIPVERYIDYWSEYKEPETGVLTAYIVRSKDTGQTRACGYIPNEVYDNVLAKVDIPWTEGQGL